MLSRGIYTSLAVAFFVICLLRRLFNKPDAARGADGADLPLFSLLAIFGCYMLLNYLLPLVVKRVLLILGVLTGFNGQHSLALINFIVQIFILLTVGCIFFKQKMVSQEEKRNNFWVVVEEAAYSFGVAMPLIVGISCGWFYILLFFQHCGMRLEFVQQDIVMLLLSLDNGKELALFMLTACLFVPVTEEMVFRGFIYRCLKHRSSAHVASFVTAFIFASLHHNILAFASLFTLSLALVRAYEQNFDLRKPILMHCFFNLFNIIVCLKFGHLSGTVN